MSTQIKAYERSDGSVAIGFEDALVYFAEGTSRPLAIAAAKQYLLEALSELDALAETVEPKELKDAN